MIKFSKKFIKFNEPKILRFISFLILYYIMGLLESILIIVIIVIILVIVWNLFFKKSNQMILDGIHPSHPQIRIDSNSLPQNVSSNFTWAIWFFINDWNVNYGQIKPILQQGGSANENLGVGSGENVSTSKLKPDNDIAIALDAFENDLLVGIKSFAQTTNVKNDTYMLPSTDYFNQQAVGDASGHYRYETYKIENIDLQKWVCLIISVDGRTLDMYLHGKLVRTFVLPNVIPGNKDTVYIGANQSPFDGHLAMVRYLPNAVNTQQAYNIYREGLSSNLLGDFFDKYRLKIQFMEYNHPVGKPLIL